MTVRREDVLALLSSRACASSSSDAEGLIREAEIIRCVDALATIAGVSSDVPALLRLHGQVTSRSQGELVVQCLRAYEEYRRGTGLVQERALAAVYEWARGHAPSLYPPALHSETDLSLAFARGKATQAKQKAAALYGDCFLVMAEFVTTWNRKQMRVA